MNKKGVLGITEIILIILAIATLVFGLVSMKQQFSKSETLTNQHISSATLGTAQNSVELELQSKDFVLSNTVFDLILGTPQILLVGVKNENSKATTYRLEIKSTDGKTNPEEWFLYKTSGGIVKPGEVEIYNLKVDSPEWAIPGESYLFEANLYSRGDPDSSDEELVKSVQFVVGLISR